MRHHADADGYCAAMALEEALIPLVQKTRTKVWHGFRRQPCKAPLYDYGDALRDLDAVKEEQLKERNVLFILTDLGAGEENLLALRRVRQHGAKVLIIDHHPGPTEITQSCDVYLNPHVKGLGSDLCAGILCAELAHLLAPKHTDKYLHLAAIASVSDRSQITEYVKHQPLTQEQLRRIGMCIDFEAATLKFTDSDSIKDVIFNQEAVVNIIASELDARREKIKLIAKAYMQVSPITLGENGSTKAKLVMLDVGRTMISDYPGSKIISIAHDMVEGPHISLGTRPDMVTVRVDGIAPELFSFRKLMEHLQTKLPHAGISGGGHDAAGTFRFVEAAYDEIMQETRRYLRLS